MSLKIPYFPLWTGLSESRLSRLDNRVPDHHDWDQLIAEFLRMQELFQSLIIDPRNFIDFTIIPSPGNPASGKVRLYVRQSDNHIVIKYANGTEIDLTEGSTGGSGTTLRYNDTPIGDIDGINPTFQLSQTPATPNILLYKNGLLQGDGDYSLIDDIITFLPEAIPSSGDQLSATYPI